MNHRITYRAQESSGVHRRLTAWVNGVCAGHLCVLEEELDVLLVIAKALDGEGATEVEGLGEQVAAERRRGVKP